MFSDNDISSSLPNNTPLPSHCATIDDLPNELLCEIFKARFLELDKEVKKCNNADDHILQLYRVNSLERLTSINVAEAIEERLKYQMVSKLWNSCIRATPSAWSHMYYDFEKEIKRPFEGASLFVRTEGLFEPGYSYQRSILAPGRIDATEAAMIRAIEQVAQGVRSAPLVSTLWLKLPTLIPGPGFANNWTNFIRSLNNVTTLVLRLDYAINTQNDILNILRVCSESSISSLRLYTGHNTIEPGSSNIQLDIHEVAYPVIEDSDSPSIPEEFVITLPSLRRLELEVFEFHSNILRFLNLPMIKILSLKSIGGRGVIWKGNHLLHFFSRHGGSLKACFIHSGPEMERDFIIKTVLTPAVLEETSVKMFMIQLNLGVVKQWSFDQDYRLDQTQANSIAKIFRYTPAQDDGDKAGIIIGYRDPDVHAQLLSEYPGDKLLTYEFIEQLKDVTESLT